MSWSYFEYRAGLPPWLVTPYTNEVMRICAESGYEAHPLWTNSDRPDALQRKIEFLIGGDEEKAGKPLRYIIDELDGLIRYAAVDKLIGRRSDIAVVSAGSRSRVINRHQKKVQEGKK